VPVVGPPGSSVSGGVAGAVTGAAGHVVSGVVGAGFLAVFDAAGQWVASGAVWLLGAVGHAMSATTSIDLSSGWFSAHVSFMAALSAALVLPMVCCAAIQAVYRQSASMLARTFLVQLPLALLLTGVAVELVQMALAVTDALSSQVMASAGVDTTNILAPVSTFLIGAGDVVPAVPAFVVFIGGLLVAMATLVLWLELVVRAAAVSVATLFLPLALAALVWPAVSHWCRRLADTLVALILSKFVIAAVLSLAAGALAGGLGVGATGGDGGGFAAVVTGVALLVIATLSPFTLLRLIPAVEAGAVSHLESTRHRLASAAQAPVRARNMALDIASKMKPGGAGAAGHGGGASDLVVGSVAPPRPMAEGTQISPDPSVSPDLPGEFHEVPTPGDSGSPGVPGGDGGTPPSTSAGGTRRSDGGEGNGTRVPRTAADSTGDGPTPTPRPSSDRSDDDADGSHGG
jgi:hypothetical protein